MITPSAGKAGQFEFATGNRNIDEVLGECGTSYDAAFHVLKY